MYKNYIRLCTILALLIMLFITGAGMASARPFTTDFTGTSICEDVPGTGETTVIDGKLHINDSESVCIDEADDSRVSGEDRIVIHAILNLNDNLSGPMWGSIIITNEGGSWVGNWTGERTSEGYVYIRMKARGINGYQGIQAWWDFERLSPDPAAPYSFSGYILEPGQ